MREKGQVKSSSNPNAVIDLSYLDEIPKKARLFEAGGRRGV